MCGQIATTYQCKRVLCFKDPPFVLGFLRANLCIVKELGDRAAQGRTYGNLGNTYYLLGNFLDAVASHEQVSVVNEMWKSQVSVWMYHIAEIDRAPYTAVCSSVCSLLKSLATAQQRGEPIATWEMPVYSLVILRRLQNITGELIFPPPVHAQYRVVFWSQYHYDDCIMFSSI